MIDLGFAAGLYDLWYFLASIDLYPGRELYELALSGFFALAISAPQYVVLRVVLGQRSGAAVAWIPVSVLVYVLEEFIVVYWFASHVSPLVGIAFFAILSLAQGLLLAEMLGRRSAALLWLVAMGAVLGEFYAASLIPGPVFAISTIAQGFVAGAIIGLMYGGVTGVFLVLLARLATTLPPAAQHLQSESELLVRL